MRPGNRRLRQTRSASRSPKRAKRKTARNTGRSSPFDDSIMEDEKPSPFADLVTGAGFLALAAAIVIGAWRMDRLQHLQASIYTAPGLVPALCSAARSDSWPCCSWRAPSARAHWRRRHGRRCRFADHWRLIAILALSLIYAIGLIGRGLPFWLASAIYVAATVFVFQFADRQAQWHARARRRFRDRVRTHLRPRHPLFIPGPVPGAAAVTDARWVDRIFPVARGIS